MSGRPCEICTNGDFCNEDERKTEPGCPFIKSKFELENEMKELQPHQQRVVTEKLELDEKIEKLKVFITNPKSLFKELSNREQGMLVLQNQVMNSYSLVLGMRIDEFC